MCDIRIITKNLLLLCVLIWGFSFGYGQNQHIKAKKEKSNRTITITELNNVVPDDKRYRYVINTPVDLKGRELILPSNIALEFNGGYFKNGYIIGNNTKIIYNGLCFDSIIVGGSWDVPIIKTSMFKTLEEDNSLQNIFALANAKVSNIIVIEDGVYKLNALRNDLECLRIPSNTEVIFNGVIVLRPNDFTHSYIFRITGENISISGRGAIIGDRLYHNSDKGQWGMGIYVLDAHNVILSNLDIKDCWGDCIYVGGNSQNIVIRNCHLDNSRRQGISVTSVDNIVIDHCLITNIGGHAPGYGVDIEPNSGQKVQDVNISNLKIINCKGGIMSYGYEERAKVGTINVNDCSVFGCTKVPMRFRGGEKVNVTNCTIEFDKGVVPIQCEGIDKYTESGTVRL